MKWPKFGVYDFYIIIVIFILNYYLLTNWSDFQSCENPINWWLFADYNLMFLTRVFYVMRNSGYRRNVKLGLNVVLFALMLPLLVCMCILGYMWEADGYKCTPDHMVPWSFLLWLILTAITSLLMFIKMLIDWRKYRKLKNYMSRMEYSQSIMNGRSLLINDFL